MYSREDIYSCQASPFMLEIRSLEVKKGSVSMHCPVCRIEVVTAVHYSVEIFICFRGLIRTRTADSGASLWRGRRGRLSSVHAGQACIGSSLY